jgi:hypothetical protein
VGGGGRASRPRELMAAARSLLNEPLTTDTLPPGAHGQAGTARGVLTAGAIFTQWLISKRARRAAAGRGACTRPSPRGYRPPARV